MSTLSTSSHRRQPLRLTRRGRLVVSVTLLLLVIAATTLFGTRSTASPEPGQGEATRTVVVDRGETLWGIAASLAGPGEVREMVHRIEKLNALPDPSLAVGQEIAVPIG